MVDRKNLRQLIGSLINISNSGLNFAIYIFMPILIGMGSYKNFQLENVKPSFLIFLFSPSLPYIIYKSKKNLYTFFVLFLIAILILLFISNRLLLIANITWLLYGLFTMVLYYQEQKKKFYTYTIGLTIVLMGLIFFLKDYYWAYVLTAILCFSFLLLKEFRGIKVLFDFEKSFSWSVVNSLLRPIFSISFFWQILLYISSIANTSDSFLDLTYYSKITLSSTVAIFSIAAMDLLKDKRIKFSNLSFLSIIAVIGVNFLIYILDHYSKQQLHINHLVATGFLICSIFPSLMFNVISDSIFYRLTFAISLGVTVLCVFLGYNSLVITVISFFLISLISLYVYFFKSDSIKI